MIIIAINNSSGINSSELQRKEQTFVKRNEGRWTGCETDHWMKKMQAPTRQQRSCLLLKKEAQIVTSLFSIMCNT